MSKVEEQEARVVRLDARGARVLLGPALGLPPAGRTHEALWCAVRGRVHHKEARAGQRTALAVGDRVLVRDLGGGRGSIERTLPRTRTFSRPDAHKAHVEHVIVANVDQVVLVASAADPPFQSSWVDRVLLVAEWSHLDAVVVVNKMDLVDAPPERLAAYEAMGYATACASATTGAGVEALVARLAGRASAVVGQSGVGKSSLLNAVQPGLGLEVGAVNAHTGRGTHTTTAAVWLPLDAGGAVVDTAGVRELGLFGIPRRDIPLLFRDLAAVADCRFPDCTHTHEPACTVLDAVEDGRVAPWRYETYVRLLDERESAQGG